MDFIIKMTIIIGLVRFFCGITMFFLGKVLKDSQEGGYHECATGLLTLIFSILFFIINYIYNAGA